MATKRITDVAYAETLNDNDSIFINQNDVIKQINKKNAFPNSIVKVTQSEYNALGDIVKTNGILYAING